MTRTPLDRLITCKSLHFVSIQHYDSIPDMIKGDSIKTEKGSIELKNVCAKVAPELAAKIDDICDLLDISKRQFIEAALIEAVKKSYAIMKAEGVLDAPFDAGIDNDDAEVKA